MDDFGKNNDGKSISAFIETFCNTHQYCKILQDSANPDRKYERLLSKVMTLTTDCTSEMLYRHLKDMGVDVKKLKQKKPSFVELERKYYELLNAKLSARSKRLSKSKY